MGFDILLDQNYKAWILEINDHPSMNVFGEIPDESTDFQEEVKTSISSIFKGSQAEMVKVISPVDLHVKSRVMQDCLELALMAPAERKGIRQQYNSLTQILPAQDEKHAFVQICVKKCR